MSKINKLVAIAAMFVSFNVFANGWQLDREGCFAVTPIHFTDGSKGEYTLTSINQSYVLVMQGDEWNLPAFGHLVGRATFTNRHSTPVDIHYVTSDRVMVRFPVNTLNRAAIISSRAVDIYLEDGSSFMTFTMFGADKVIPGIEQCIKTARIQ